MAKDSGNTKLWKGNGLRIDEINSVLNAGSGNLGVLCTSNNINPWAKYKPFRSSSKGFANKTEWENAAKAVGFGFGTQSEITNTTNGLAFWWSSSTSPAWENHYLKPRGVNDSYNEPYRQLDFVDIGATSTQQYGYDKYAAPPMEIEFCDGRDHIYQGNDEVTCSFDWAIDNAQWISNDWMSIADVMSSLISAINAGQGNYNLAVLFKPVNGTKSLLITNIQPTVFANTPCEYLIPFTGDSLASTQMYGPYIPAIGNARDGDKIDVVTCLVENQPPSSGNYRVVNGDDMNDFKLVSLNMRGNMDRIRLKVLEKDSIVGTRGTIQATIVPVSAIYDSNYGSCPTFRIDDINVFFDTGALGPYWNTRTGVDCHFFVELSTTSMTFFLSGGSESTIDDETYVVTAGDARIKNDGSQSSNLDLYESISNLSTSTSFPTTKYVLSYNGSSRGKIKFPYISIASGTGSAKIRITGALFTGGNPNDPRPLPEQSGQPGGVQLISYEYNINI